MQQQNGYNCNMKETKTDKHSHIVIHFARICAFSITKAALLPLQGQLQQRTVITQRRGATRLPASLRVRREMTDVLAT